MKELDNLKITGSVKLILEGGEHKGVGDDNEYRRTILIPNQITNFARDWFISTLLDPAYASGNNLPPAFIGLGTTQSVITPAATTLDNPESYDGTNAAKEAESRTRFQQSVRIHTQFTTGEANFGIRQLGLFDAANDGNLWAIINTNLVKIQGERLSVFWYLAVGV